MAFDKSRYSLMLRHAADRLEVQRLLDDLSADSALSRRGGGGGLNIDSTTAKMLKQRCTHDLHTVVPVPLAELVPAQIGTMVYVFSLRVCLCRCAGGR